MDYKVYDKGRSKLRNKHFDRWIFIICISFTLSVIIYALHCQTSVKKNGKKTTGVVIDKRTRIKTGVTFYYEYIVDGKNFIGKTSEIDMPYRIQIGDTLEIRYDSTCVSRSHPVDENSSWW